MAASLRSPAWELRVEVELLCAQGPPRAMNAQSVSCRATALWRFTQILPPRCAQVLHGPRDLHQPAVHVQVRHLVAGLRPVRAMHPQVSTAPSFRCLRTTAIMVSLQQAATTCKFTGMVQPLPLRPHDASATTCRTSSTQRPVVLAPPPQSSHTLSALLTFYLPLPCTHGHPLKATLGRSHSLNPHPCPRTTRHAFAADSLLSLVYQIVRGNFPPIPTDQFTSGLSDLVNRLLARDAAARPSLGEVRTGRSGCRAGCQMECPGWRPWQLGGVGCVGCGSQGSWRP